MSRSEAPTPSPTVPTKPQSAMAPTRSPSASLSLPTSPLPSSSAAARSSSNAVATSPAPSAEPPITPSSSASTASIHTATPSTTSSKRSKFWSRFSLPKPLSPAKSNRYLADFHVRPDEPHRKYNPGDHVHGSVVLTVVKPVRITHLVVTLHGYVHVVRDPAAAAKSMVSGPGTKPLGGSTGPQYHGNGLASLFQDEQVLSGEGRLEPGKYDFGFDLVFPSEGLPSSIDFERGTISYLVTAALTRPNAIAPVTTCDRKILLQQQCDVGDIPAPRPQTIWLEPTRKHARRRKRSTAVEKHAVATPEVTELGSEADHGEQTPDGTTHHHSNSSREHQPETRVGDQSDLRSEISGESGRSTSTGFSRAEMSQITHVSTNVTSAAKQQEVNDKTISATIEVPKGGFVAGDVVPVRISIRHNKHMKSMSGIIVTLFRQGSIDLAPSPSAFEEAQQTHVQQLMETNKILPRTRTGLGGLSLSSTGSTMVFRKDLDQNTVPLIIDPHTLTGNMTVSVKLPDDSFPTIKDVPGDMIRFTYQVEVIMDLGGRMSNSYHGPHSSRLGPLGSNTSESTNASYGPRRGANIADTAHIRRMEGVFSCALSIVVGTTDSAKTRRRKKSSAKPHEYPIDENDLGDSQRASSNQMAEQPIDSYFPPLSNGHHLGTPLTIHPPPQNQLPPPVEAGPPYQPVNGYRPGASPAYVPPPQLPDETIMTEKERIRQAETRLLPSQPAANGSSAPPDDDLYDAEDTPRLQPASLNQAVGQHMDDNAGEGPSAPTADDLAAPGPGSAAAEDKQELERQRLIHEASAPPEFPDDMERRPDGPSRPDHTADADAEPSAPVLDEEDEYAGYGVGAGPSNSQRRDVEQLPAYER